MWFDDVFAKVFHCRHYHPTSLRKGICSSAFFLILCLFIRYDPSTGIYGMDFYVVLERPGYRVGRRRRCKSRVGIQHRVTKDDAMKWFQVKYEGVILNKSQNIGN